MAGSALQNGKKALERYRDLMSALDQNLSELQGNTKAKIAVSVKATDIYRAGDFVRQFLEDWPAIHRVAK